MKTIFYTVVQYNLQNSNIIFTYKEKVCCPTSVAQWLTHEPGSFSSIPGWDTCPRCRQPVLIIDVCLSVSEINKNICQK